MNIAAIKESGSLLFECISGSKLYGLDTETSDTDIRGVFVLPKEQYFGMDYSSQVSNETNDEVYYELNKFLELCYKNNPNALELLAIPADCILYKHPLYENITLDLFLSKQCEHSFLNYALTQIKKARGLEKKLLNPMDEQRKSVLAFCYVYEHGETVLLDKFLERNGYKQSECGLRKLNHLKNGFSLFHSNDIPYRGIVSGNDVNEVCLSTIPKDEKPIALLYFNKEGYATYCKKYKEYWDWVANRNIARYTTNMKHGKDYDSKNMMHTLRLLRMAEEIAEEGRLQLRRNDREFLLGVKSGDYEYDELLTMADHLKMKIISLFKESKLQEYPNRNKINLLAYELREKFYYAEQLRS